MTNTHFTVHLTDYFATVREYTQGLLTDETMMYYEDGDWRRLIPKGASVNVYRTL